ncbi:hypothetical protein ACFC6L_30810 [Kitasatospora phosalacinea]|uniref:hypothetical protein n=1 Tax=Kitasatospora phosalacinea TaxID=2065 RepID=UPI0035D8CF05
MSGDGEELSVRMARYVAAEEAAAPPSRVDPALAVLRGRARRRRRAWTVVAAAAAAVLSTGSFAVLQDGGGAGPAEVPAVLPTGSPTGGTESDAFRKTAPTEQSSAAPVVGRTVLTVPARFGWLPDSVPGVTYRSDPLQVDVVAGGRPGVSERFELTAFPVGVTPDVDPLIGAGDGLRIDAPPVNGQEAYWVSSSDPAFAAAMDTLRFRSADGRWFQLESAGLSGADRQQVPLRVAAGVVPGDYAPPMPLALSSLPERSVLSGVELYLPLRGEDRWEVRVNFQEQLSHYLVVHAGPDLPDPSANVLPGQSFFPEKCATGGGVKWCVNTTQPVAGSEVGDPAAWLARVVAFGNDRAAWSTDVLP